jgi:hypothetical protein
VYKKTCLWLVAALIGSIPPVHAGRPSTPPSTSTQPPAQPAPAAPNPTTPNPNTTAPQVSGTPNSPDDSTNPQPGFLDTTAGKVGLTVAKTVVYSAVGMGVAQRYQAYQRKKKNEELLKKQYLIPEIKFTFTSKTASHGGE